MRNIKRGILYLVWGTSSEPALQRSIQSVRRYHPDLPFHVVRGNADEGLRQKSRMASLSPFETTLYLDADTVVMGNLDYGFERAEQFGLGCTINECPWLRRYGQEMKDHVEYNTGVLFFSPLAREVFRTWEQIAPTTASQSMWLHSHGELLGLPYDDQAGFSQAIVAAKWNPFILPVNWNLRPTFHQRFFAPIKIWHDYRDPPAELLAMNEACHKGSRPVSLVDMVKST